MMKFSSTDSTGKGSRLNGIGAGLVNANYKKQATAFQK